MKKVLAILAAIVFCGFGANAQGKSCPVPGTSQSIQITSIYRTGNGYGVSIKNNSPKTVYFKVTAIGCVNMEQCVAYGTIGSRETSVTFTAKDSSKECKMDDVKLEVTGCDE